ncbi:hypothetical protein, partial [Kribbella monticola]|uniref:hypothetical protein n=1 Tax=Kribbella monticola TaxID=2185285 RepID=UPI001E43E968
MVAGGAAWGDRVLRPLRALLRRRSTHPPRVAAPSSRLGEGEVVAGGASRGDRVLRPASRLLRRTLDPPAPASPLLRPGSAKATWSAGEFAGATGYSRPPPATRH